MAEDGQLETLGHRMIEVCCDTGHITQACDDEITLICWVQLPGAKLSLTAPQSLPVPCTCLSMVMLSKPARFIPANVLVDSGVWRGLLGSHAQADAKGS